MYSPSPKHETQKMPLMRAVCYQSQHKSTQVGSSHNEVDWSFAELVVLGGSINVEAFN